MAHDRYENQIKNYATSRNTLSQDISKIHKNKREKTRDLLIKMGSRKEEAENRNSRKKVGTGTMIIPNEKEPKLHGRKKRYSQRRS